MGVAENLLPHLKWSSFFSLLPIYKTKSRKFRRTRNLGVKLLIYLIFFVGSTRTYVRHLLFESRIVFVLAVLISLSLLATNITYMLGSVAWNFGKVQKLFRTLNEIDSMIKDDIKIKFATAKFVVFNILIFVIIFYNYVIFNIEDISKYNFHNSFTYFQLYNHLIFIYVKYSILKCIDLRYKALNKILDYKLYTDISNVIKLQYYLTESIRIFNVIFGIHMFLADLINMLNILIGVGVFLIIPMRSTEFLADFSWILLDFAGSVLISSVCQSIANEGSKLTKTTYKMSIKSTEFKFHVFAKYTAACPPVISAGGLFNVNFAMLFMTFDVIVNYVIVVIQFSKNVK